MDFMKKYIHWCENSDESTAEELKALSGNDTEIDLKENEITYIDLVEKSEMKAGKFTVKGNSFFWLKRA